MLNEFTRKTIAKRATFEGLGLHSGTAVRVQVHPGNRGIWFRFRSSEIEAIPENVSGTQRCTQLGEISTIEHLMSALAGLEITDAEIEVSAPELPALDGSALPFFHTLKDSGIDTVGTASIEGPFARLFVKEGDAKIAIGSGNGHWHYQFHSPERWPVAQDFELHVSPDHYEAEVAPARTWGFEEEVDAILAAGLAKGLDWDSALVIGKMGYKNKPRFPDEPARHKWLDLLGDLALSRVPARFINVTASRSGHRLNVQAARLLRDSVTVNTGG